jgi:hypothetical protein
MIVKGLMLAKAWRRVSRSTQRLGLEVYHSQDGGVNMSQVEEKLDLETDDQIGDRLMISSLHVENFRCFGSLDLTGLRRINIIVGRNASGKTALLETVKMGLDGHPNIAPWMNQLRNIPFVMLGNPTPEQFKAQFMDLFHGFDIDGRISISIQDSEHRTASVRIYFDPNKATTAERQSVGFQRAPGFGQSSPISLPPVTIIPLAFERVDFQGQKSILLATINQEGQPFLQPGKPLGIVSGFIANAYYGGPGENAAWLSQLSIQKRKPELLEAVQRHFPFILDLSSESTIPGMPGTVYADLSGLSKTIPLSLASGGISRLITIILATVSYRNGVVLIDEVENGLFHDQYSQLWRTILDLAKHYNTQVFVSTHSKECLTGAIEAMNSDPGSFALLRARREEGHSSIEVFGGEMAEAALEKNGEVRD